MRHPGAIVLDRVSRRMTRPSMSRLRNDGTSESMKLWPLRWRRVPAYPSSSSSDSRLTASDSAVCRDCASAAAADGNCRYQYGSSSMMMMSNARHTE